MKYNFLLIITLFCFKFSFSQKKIDELKFTAAFKKILESSYKNFETIKGERVGTSDTFTSKVNLPGAKIYLIPSSMSSLYAIIKNKDSAENGNINKQVINAISKAYAPLKVKTLHSKSFGYNQTVVHALTTTGFHNWRVAVNEIYDLPNSSNTISIYVSAINKREFIEVRKDVQIKDDVLKKYIATVFDKYKIDKWESITKEAAGNTEEAEANVDSLPFYPPFSIYDGIYYNTSLQMKGALSFIKKENDGNTAFIIGIKIPKTIKPDKIEAYALTMESRLKYALPDYFVSEKPREKKTYYYNTFFKHINFDIYRLDGIEVKTELSDPKNDEQYFLIEIKFD